jgi:hypothetical protein
VVHGNAGAFRELSAVVLMVMVVPVADEPLGVTVDGEKLQLAFDGRPEHENATASLKPFSGVTLIVALPLLPGETVIVAFAGLMVKSGGCGAPTSVVVSAWVFAASVLPTLSAAML